jgi:hypothetical protein
MPPLTDIGKYKRLADLFALALKIGPSISAQKNAAALTCLMDYGLIERQADSFLSDGLDRIGRGMVRDAEEVVKEVCNSFRMREHELIITQIQQILEAGEITPEVQSFFDLCSQHLHHDG